MDYFLLIFSLLFFGISHSILASSYLKSKFETRFYRLIYNVLSLITFGFIYWQYQKSPDELLFASFFNSTVSSFLIGLSLGFLLSTLLQYNLKEFSGFDAFGSKSEEIHLKTDGFLRFVRHPLYSAIILLAITLFINEPTIKNGICLFASTLYILIGIYFEEKKLVRLFGDDYNAYKAKTPMLIPKFW